MSKKACDDINIEELDRDSLISLIRSERKSHKSKIRKVKEWNRDTEIALAMAIAQRSEALAQLDKADMVIMSIVDQLVANDKFLPPKIES